MMKFDRRFIIRLCAIVFVLLLGVVLFFVGKQHTILLDNKDIEINGVQYKAPALLEIQVDKQESLELAKRDRDKAVVTNQKHKVTVTYTDDYWNEIVKTVTFRMPVGEKMMLLNIPAMLADLPQDQWITHYEPPTVAEGVVRDEVISFEDTAAIVGDF